MYNSFMAAAVLSLCAHMLKAENIKYSDTVLNRCIEPQDSFVKLIGISIQECVDACVKRHSCKSLGYNRGMNFCELHKDEPLKTHPTATACVFIRREDMETKSVSIVYPYLLTFIQINVFLYVIHHYIEYVPQINKC